MRGHLPLLACGQLPRPPAGLGRAARGGRGYGTVVSTLDAALPAVAAVSSQRERRASMLLLPLLLASSAAAATDLPPVRTSRPVIGILTQPTDVDKSYNLSSYGNAYLVASYVRWVESAGARAVPVPWSASEEELREIFLTTNGILFPGGGTSLSGHGGPEGVAYKAAGATLFALAKAANDAGTVYPIWGTCLGFEEVMELSVNSTSVLRRTTGTDPMLAPVTLTAAATQSKLLAASPSTRDALENSGNVSIHLHGFGVYLDTFTPNVRMTDITQLLFCENAHTRWRFRTASVSRDTLLSCVARLSCAMLSCAERRTTALR